MRAPIKLLIVLSFALIFVAASQGQETEAALGEEEEDAGKPKRNLAALAKNGRLPRFHYHKKQSPERSSFGYGDMMGDQAFQGDAAEKFGVVGALGRLSEATIFPYIGPHRFPFLRTMRMRRDVQEEETSDESMAKRNVAALARNGWLPKIRSTRTRQGPTPKRDEELYMPDSSFQDFYDDEDDEDCIEDDDVDAVQLEEQKRNLAHLAGTGRLPPFHWRRNWFDDKRGRTLWPQPRPSAGKRGRMRRCGSAGEAAKRNVAAMARKGLLPRS